MRDGPGDRLGFDHDVDFAEDSQTIEVRKDPLLGDTSVFNPELKDKAQMFFGSCDQELIDKLVVDTAENCFFCGDTVEKSTPQFTSDFSEEGGCTGMSGHNDWLASSFEALRHLSDMEVSLWPMRPPVHDSATDNVISCSLSNSPTTASMVLSPDAKT